MTRIALGVEYNGTPFCGWQYQDHSPSVQEEVEKALSKVANHDVRVICAGRTDTGVHATEQVIHFDTEVERTDYQWVFGANANLPDSISLIWAKPVSDEFHARFSAIRRRYRYVIFNRKVRPALLSKRSVWEYRPLDETLMAKAAKFLEGEQDFSSYRALGCQAKSPIRTLNYLKVHRQDELVILDLEANAFLQHMVRNIAGVLMTIGAGEQPIEWANEILQFRDRTRGGVTAPPDGLYLTGVDYPDEFNIPKLSRMPVVC
ncbi:MAG: tRNA pseudouridine(38-40) synthase TruA [Gammaproteobacteria bacterium]|nr:tRNA pseudouridine(38-40) synthase TruA [Gammaproteobacteria bacterium]MDH5776905.1 tRNA pseudouridine(38-40) synthase TruA [Gammaproteobacteria bacterium]